MKKIAYIFFALFLVVACKDTTDDGPITDGSNGQDPITGVRLVFPFENSLCNEGANATPSESTVFFEWEPNNNADNYTLTLENLSTGNIIEYETVDFIFPVTIERAVAFRWSVSYNYQDESRVSAIWNFYNAGPGVQTYAPFPAEIESPIMAETFSATNSITLLWTGSDVDNDIISYDIYFDINNPPSLNTSNISTDQLSVSVAPGNIYYWNVVTKDAEGNSSESGVYQFRVLD